MPFNIIRADITKMETDAIVNAANSRLLAGGGVCGAIFNAAGSDKLQAACNKIGFCGIGEAVITKGFDLKAKFVIHTVGPIYVQAPVKDFLKENEMEIYLVVYDNNAFKISEKLFSDVQSFIDEKLIKPDDRKRRTEEFLSYAYSESTQLDNQLDSSPIYPTTNSASVTKSSILKKKSLEELMNIKAETFSKMLLHLIDEKKMTDVEVYKRANIDRKLFSKIRKKDYTPKKTTVVALIIALRLNMKEARELLARAGFAFSQSSKFDIIIEYFIERQSYDIFEINETLFAFDQQLLGV